MTTNKEMTTRELVDEATSELGLIADIMKQLYAKIAMQDRRIKELEKICRISEE